MPEQDDIGYGRPPKASRFRKGKSGNPLGRPRKDEAVAKEFLTILNEKVKIRESGEEKKISKRRAIIMQLVNKAMSGDVRAIKILEPYLHIPKEGIVDTRSVKEMTDQELDELIFYGIPRNWGPIVKKGKEAKTEKPKSDEPKKDDHLS
jgi:hypothetical protein